MPATSARMTVERCFDHTERALSALRYHSPGRPATASRLAPPPRLGESRATVDGRVSTCSKKCRDCEGTWMTELVNNVLNKSASESVCWNFKLLAHHELGGFGGMGEGMAVQIAKDGRRIIWLAHESAPKNFTGVDVSDPRNPKVIVQTELPQAYMRSNSLEMTGDILAVAYQTQKVGQQKAGLELFDCSMPEKPKSISFFDCSGPNSRGV